MPQQKPTPKQTCISLEQELKQSYLDYAMSVIAGRALPDVRDGLKPVHRRILYAMRELGNFHNKPYKKSARIVGDVIGKYHPHGDKAVYDAIVRMAQNFSMRYVLVDGQGNFGSVDGDSAAAMRYTEIKMSKLSDLLMLDLDKETVDFSSNYDELELIPNILPSRIPNLLVNGSSGIAVGMATNIPPHNLSEVINGIIALTFEPKITLDELMSYISGPDFPTGGYINGLSGIKEAYETGKGTIIIRAKANIVRGKTYVPDQIIVSELPYQVNKSRLIEKISSLIREKKIDGISEIRDESDKDGIRVVFDIKRSINPEIVLNNLYIQTQIQTSFGINIVALVNGHPKILNLKNLLEIFVSHRKEIITRRSIYELKKMKNRLHILAGFIIVMKNIDKTVSIIKTMSTTQEVREGLSKYKWDNCLKIDQPSKYYFLSEIQITAILDLKLSRLAHLEQKKILLEYDSLLIKIEEVKLVLSDSNILFKVLREELLEIQKTFGDKRRSEILSSSLDLVTEDLIAVDNMMVTLSHSGYIKAQPISEYNSQRRGGRGKSAIQMKHKDFIYKLSMASTHDTMMCFSSLGKVYFSKVYLLPQVGRIAKGKPTNNFFPLKYQEKITAMLPVPNFQSDDYVLMATKKGVVKKVKLESFANKRKSGIHALTIDKEDELMHVSLTNDSHDIMMFSNAGKAILFFSKSIRPMGRLARGVRGMSLQKDHILVALISAIQKKSMILTVTENGYGKRTSISSYRKTARGSQGVISISTSKRNGLVISSSLVDESDDIILITSRGVLIRMSVSEIREAGRLAQGVRLIKLKEDEKLVSMQVVYL